MNIASLSVKMMVNTTRVWLEDKGLREALLKVGELGYGVLAELGSAHTYLGKLAERRRKVHKRLRALVDLIAKLDATHDRKARALYYALNALIEMSDDAEDIATYQGYKAQLFPAGLRVIRLPYVEESGAAEELELSVDKQLRAELGAIVVGKHNLGQVLEQWIAAGKALGEAVNERTKLRASLKRKGSAADKIDISVGRKVWVKAVKGLLWLIDLKPELAPLLEPVEAALSESIDLSQRRRASGGGGVSTEDDEELDELDDDELDDDELDDDELDDDELDDELDDDDGAEPEGDDEQAAAPDAEQPPDSEDEPAAE